MREADPVKFGSSGETVGGPGTGSVVADLRKKLGVLDVFPLVLGGNVFGWTSGRDDSFAVLDAYIDGGGNAIDTADQYSAWVDGNRGGESEVIIGEWLASRRNRDNVVIATKVGRHPDFTGLSAATIKNAAEASLRRLGTDRIDLYYSHLDDTSVPVAEIVTALDGLVREGKVREIGASNLSPRRLEESLLFSEREGLARYVVLQPHYSLVSRATYEGELEEVVARYGLAALPYYGLASGFLTGKYRPGRSVDSARSETAAGHLTTERGGAVLAALDAIAQARALPVATVALAWLAAKPTVAALIASARTVEQVPPLLAATTTELAPEEVRHLDEASA